MKNYYVEPQVIVFEVEVEDLLCSSTFPSNNWPGSDNVIPGVDDIFGGNTI